MLFRSGSTNMVGVGVGVGVGETSDVDVRGRGEFRKWGVERRK